MHEPDDHALLRQYAEQNSETAFAALVARHVDKVYSTALRHTRNVHAAEEITQSVFVILAKKSGRLGGKVILAGWLYETARLTAVTFIRSEIRRAHREQEAHMQTALNENADDAWPHIAPLLDDALAGLIAADRHAVVLRYFDGKSLGEVGAALGASEDAAKKRVTRAVEKLRGWFTKRGVTLTATVLTAAISANSVQAAPLGLAATVTATAVKGAVVSGSTLTLIKGALKIMAWTKMKTAALVGGVLLLGGSAVVVKENYFPSEPSYQGRKLSEWLGEIGYSQPQDKRDLASDAIRHMGTKTLPFLLATFENNKSKDDQLGQTTWAFDALGPIAKSKIPKLAKLQERYPGYVPSALAGIGTDAVPVLLRSLTNDNFFIRDNTAAALANAIFSGKIPAGTAKAALPIALNNLGYRNLTNSLFEVNTRHRAASLIRALHLNPDESVPPLLKCMEESMDEGHYTVAGQCALALGGFGKDALPAIPRVIHCLETTMDHSTNMNAIACATDCIIALGYFGKDARTAVPVLTKAVNSTNTAVSLMAMESLKRIQ